MRVARGIVGLSLLFACCAEAQLRFDAAAGTVNLTTNSLPDIPWASLGGGAGSTNAVDEAGVLAIVTNNVNFAHGFRLGGSTVAAALTVTPRCRLNITGHHDIGSGYEKLAFDSEAFDNYNMGDTANTRIIIRLAGTYKVTFVGRGYDTPGDTVRAAIYKNGALERHDNATGNAAPKIHISYEEDYAVDDYLEAYVYGANTGGIYDTSHATWFEVTYIGP